VVSNYLERMQERWVGLWTSGKVVRNYLERMQERWVGLWTSGKVVSNYLERMQERWVGRWTKGKVVRKARLQPSRMVKDSSRLDRKESEHTGISRLFNIFRNMTYMMLLFHLTWSS
jgi:hypothetical protein